MNCQNPTLVKYSEGSLEIKLCDEIEISQTDHSASQLIKQVFVIEDFDELDKLANSWLKKKCLAIDTEFERRTTFYAKLALVQVYDGEAIYLIDPLEVDCPDSLREVLENPKISKILHSSKEDLEVLYTSWNCQLAGLFDTQVAYRFINNELSIGYAKLVEELTGHLVSKQQTKSDWIKRPLSNEQLSYAARDVLYLIDIYKLLKEQLSDKDYRHYFQAECDEYCVNGPCKIDTPADFRDAKDVWQLNETDLGLFKLLFNWREKKAKTDDKTRNHIIHDQGLVHLTKMKPNSTNQLKVIQDLHPRSIRLYADDWFDIISKWKSSRQQSIATVPNPRDVHQLKALSTALESMVKSVAKVNQVSHTLLLSKRSIRKLAFSILTDSQPPSQWSGWRKALLEESVKQKAKQFIVQ